MNSQLETIKEYPPKKSGATTSQPQNDEKANMGSSSNSKNGNLLLAHKAASESKSLNNNPSGSYKSAVSNAKSPTKSTPASMNSSNVPGTGKVKYASSSQSSSTTITKIDSGNSGTP